MVPVSVILYASSSDVCHVCLRTCSTMTSLMQGKIIGYLPWALIWIGHFFVYQTSKNIRFTYKYVIISIILLVWILRYFTFIVHGSPWSYGSWISNYSVPMQSVPITTKVVSFNPAHGKVYLIQHYVIKFVSDLWQSVGFLWVLQFPPPIKLNTMI
jgi:hypothetical protein